MGLSYRGQITQAQATFIWAAALAGDKSYRLGEWQGWTATTYTSQRRCNSNGYNYEVCSPMSLKLPECLELAAFACWPRLQTSPGLDRYMAATPPQDTQPDSTLTVVILGNNPADYAE